MRRTKSVSIIFAISFISLLFISVTPASAQQGNYNPSTNFNFKLNPFYLQNPLRFFQDIMSLNTGGTSISITPSEGRVATHDPFQPYALWGNTIRISDCTIFPNLDKQSFAEDKTYTFKVSYKVTFLDYKNNAQHTRAHIICKISSSLNGDWRYANHFALAYTPNVQGGTFTSGGAWKPTTEYTETFTKQLVNGGSDVITLIFQGIYSSDPVTFEIGRGSRSFNIVSRMIPVLPSTATNKTSSTAPNLPAGYTTNPLVTCYQCQQGNAVRKIFYDTTTCPSGWTSTVPDCTGTMSFDLLGQHVAINPWWLVGIIVAAIAITIFMLWRARRTAPPKEKIPATPKPPDEEDEFDSFGATRCRKKTKYKTRPIKRYNKHLKPKITFWTDKRKVKPTEINIVLWSTHKKVAPIRKRRNAKKK